MSLCNVLVLQNGSTVTPHLDFVKHLWQTTTTLPNFPTIIYGKATEGRFSLMKTHQSEAFKRWCQPDLFIWILSVSMNSTWNNHLRNLFSLVTVTDLGGCPESALIPLIYLSIYLSIGLAGWPAVYLSVCLPAYDSYHSLLIFDTGINLSIYCSVHACIPIFDAFSHPSQSQFISIVHKFVGPWAQKKTGVSLPHYHFRWLFSLHQPLGASFLCLTKSYLWLVGQGHPSEKYERQLGWWHSQYMGK